jgi:hypothetical protein
MPLFANHEQAVPVPEFLIVDMRGEIAAISLITEISS